MKKSLIYFIMLSTLLQVSCKKSIEVEPTSLLTSGTFWKSESDAIGALNGMYVSLRTVAVQNLFILGEARAQTMAQALAGTVGLDIFYLNSLDVDNISVNWTGLYKTIDEANLILKYVPNITITTAGSKNNILAQAYTTRAYAYFVMARSWGGVPLRTEPTEGYDPMSIQIARSTVDEVMALVKADLEKAIPLYPTNNFATGRNTWTKAGANALKADVFLWTGKLMKGGTADFQAALAATEEVQKADVSLLPNFNDIFSYDNKGNKEVIMASRFQVLESDNNIYQYMYLNASNNPSNITQATKDVIGVIGSGNAGNSIMQVAAPIRNQFMASDKRRAATFYEIFSTTNVLITTITGAKGTGTVQAGVRHFKNDIMLYRYADVLLMKAEAKNALGMDPATEMNLVRARAYGSEPGHTFVNGSKADNDNAILRERLLELTSEGKRWWDVRRFGKVFELVPSMQANAGKDYMLLFPIGNAIRSLEPKVVENPGWAP
ncbi:MAG: RagB/SusD family nutrient uptake outer membrane protein [Chitinophagaceae bacterium]